MQGKARDHGGVEARVGGSMMLKCSSRDLYSEKLLGCVTSGTERSSGDHAGPSDDNSQALQRILGCLKLKNGRHITLFIIPLYRLRDVRANF